MNDQHIAQIIHAKNNISIFKNMADNDIKSILKDVKFLHYNENEKIIQEGEKSKEVYLLISGECAVKHRGKEVAKILPNEPFGEFAPITHEERKATIIATTDVKVIVFSLDIELLEEKLKGFTILYKNFVDELIRKLEASNDR